MRSVVHRKNEALAKHDPCNEQVRHDPQPAPAVVRIEDQQLHDACERQPERHLQEGERQQQVALIVEHTLNEEELP